MTAVRAQPAAVLEESTRLSLYQGVRDRSDRLGARVFSLAFPIDVFAMTALRRPRSLALLSMLGLLSACGGEPRPATPAPVVQAPTAAAVKPVKIGIALGGGAVKG
ncbi:hypothetical protein XVE_2382, partial [Xanthomonas vesicatoria ATCC 35937]